MPYNSLQAIHTEEKSGFIPTLYNALHAISQHLSTIHHHNKSI